MITKIIPTIRVDSIESIQVALAISPPTVVVRAQELICRHTGKFSAYYFKVRDVGGIHKYLGYGGKVILSFVMRDDILRKLDPIAYETLINTLLPDFYTFPDCETYQNEDGFSSSQIKKSLELGLFLIPRCNSKPIGQVKGNNEKQIPRHLELFERLGIDTLIFHTGDFFRCGQIARAKHFCSIIKKPTNTLLLYGFGAQKRLEEFDFADSYITYSHMVMANSHKIYSGRQKKTNIKLSLVEAAEKNLIQMHANLLDLHKQTKLYKEGKLLWAEALEQATEQIIRR